METWVVPLAASPGVVAACRALLDPSELARADRLRTDALRRRYICAHGALRRILGQRTGQPPRALTFAALAAGKPVLHRRDEAPAIHFNLSHAGDWALVGLSPQGPVGVDIELLAQFALFFADLHDALAPGERAAIAALLPSLRARAAARCWVRKEALLKAAGCGIGGGGLERLEVSVGEDARLLLSTHPRVRPQDWSLAALEPPGASWTAALALRGPMPPPVVRHWRWET